MGHVKRFQEIARLSIEQSELLCHRYGGQVSGEKLETINANVVEFSAWIVVYVRAIWSLVNLVKFVYYQPQCTVAVT